VHSQTSSQFLLLPVVGVSAATTSSTCHLVDTVAAAKRCPGIHPRGQHVSTVVSRGTGYSPPLSSTCRRHRHNPGPVWSCPACSHDAAKGSVLCSAFNHWRLHSGVGLRYNRNLSVGWTCQLCTTTLTQPPPTPSQSCTVSFPTSLIYSTHHQSQLRLRLGSDEIVLLKNRRRSPFIFFSRFETHLCHKCFPL